MPLRDLVSRANLSAEKRRLRAMHTHIGLCASLVNTSITITAPIPASLIDANVNAFDAPACKPLILILSHVQWTFQQRFEQPIINTSGVLNAVLLQIDFFCTGIHPQAVALSNFSQPLCECLFNFRSQLLNAESLFALLG